ncbi:MAG: hypothetical protein GF398_20355 [Chitinivibrionales bacterium]|nr:hypothetical protein [Chitinivibrionales bacterium]
MRDTVGATVYATMNGAYKSIDEYDFNLPGELVAVIALCMQVDLNKRLDSAGKAAAILRKLQSGGDAVGKPELSDANRKSETNPTLYWGRLSNALQSGVINAFAYAKTRDWQRIGIFARKTVRTALPVAQKIARREIRAATRLATITRRIVASIRESESRRKIATWTGLSGIGIAGCALLIAFLTNKKAPHPAVTGKLVEIERNIRKERESFSRHVQSQLDQIGTLLEENEIDRALESAQEVIQTSGEEALGYLLKGRILLEEGEYQNARNALLDARGKRGWHAAIRMEKNRLLPAIKQELSEGKASVQLQHLVVHFVVNQNIADIRPWLGAKQYWVRWNTVYILQQAGKKIDMVPIHILDLKYAGSARTRRRAAEELGDSSDKRAVPALKEAANRGLSDPFVSFTAATILEEKFPNE